jgi:hypothetical protein
MTNPAPKHEQTGGCVTCTWEVLDLPAGPRYIDPDADASGTDDQTVAEVADTPPADF